MTSQSAILIWGKKSRKMTSIEEARRNVEDVLGKYLARLTSALENTLKPFAEKMYEKQLISEYVKNNPESANKVISDFKAKFGFVGTLSDLFELLKCFLDVLRDLGGASRSAAEKLEEELTKACSVHPRSKSFPNQDTMSVRGVNSAYCVPNGSLHLMHSQSAPFFLSSNPDRSTQQSHINTTDPIQFNSISATDHEEYSQFPEEVQTRDESLPFPQVQMVLGNSDGGNITASVPPLGGSKATQDHSDQLSSKTPQPESNKKPTQISKAHSETSMMNSPSALPYRKYPSCPDCKALNQLRNEELQREVKELKEKLQKFEEERQSSFLNEKSRFEEERKKIMSDISEREKRLEDDKSRLEEDKCRFEEEKRNSRSEIKEKETKLEERKQQLEEREKASKEKEHEREMQLKEREAQQRLQLDQKEKELAGRERDISLVETKRDEEFRQTLRKLEGRKNQQQREIMAERHKMEQAFSREQSRMALELKKAKDEVTFREEELENKEVLQIHEARKLSQEKKEISDRDQEVRERQRKLERKESELKEKEREVTNLQLSQVVKHQKELEKMNERKQELKTAWKEYWLKEEQFSRREKKVKTSEELQKIEQQKLKTKESFLCLLNYISFSLFFVVISFILFFMVYYHSTS